MSDLQIQNERDQADGKHDAPPAKTTPERPETQAVRSMLERGVSDPAAYASYLASHPAARNEILELLHQSLGNGFVTQVVDQVNASQGRGKPPSAKDRAEVMEMFREVNGDAAPAPAPPSGSSSAKPSEEQKARARAAYAEIEDAERAQGIGKPPSEKNRAEAMELFREVNGGPTPAAPPAPASASASSSSTAPAAPTTAPGVGRPPSEKDRAEVMEMFREVNGDPAPAAPPPSSSSAAKPTEEQKARARAAYAEIEDAERAQGIGKPPSEKNRAEAMELFREVNGGPSAAPATATATAPAPASSSSSSTAPAAPSTAPGVGRPPSAKDRAEVMEMFREVNGDAAPAAPPPSSSSAAKPSEEQKARARAAYAEIEDAERAMGIGKPPSEKNRAEAMELFREVNGGPTPAAPPAPVSSSSASTAPAAPSTAPGVGRPPSEKDRAEVMEMFREVNGGPAPAAPPAPSSSAAPSEEQKARARAAYAEIEDYERELGTGKAPAAPPPASASAAKPSEDQKARARAAYAEIEDAERAVAAPAVGKPPSEKNRAEAMEMFREVNDEPGRGKPPSEKDRAEVMEMFREVNGEPTKPAETAAAQTAAAPSAPATSTATSSPAPSDAQKARARAALADIEDAERAMGIGKPPSEKDRAEVMEMFREVNGDPVAAPPAPAAATATVAATTPGVGKPPSEKDRAEVMEMFREVNGEPGRGKPPSEKDRAEVMEMFREVNGEPAAKPTESKAEFAASADVKPPVQHAHELLAASAPVKVTATALHVRRSPDTATSGNILGVLHHGAVVTPLGREGAWLEIEHAGQKAYIHGGYVTAASGASAPAPLKGGPEEAASPSAPPAPPGRR